MSKKRKIYYEIQNDGQLWWQPKTKKWIELSVKQEDYGFCNTRTCKTKRRALNAAFDLKDKYPDITVRLSRRVRGKSRWSWDDWTIS